MDLLDNLYDNIKEKIYLNENILNVSEINKRSIELIGLDEYIPNLLRPYLGLTYYTNLEKKENYQSIIKEMNKTRKQSIEDDVIEFINWIDTHKEYHTFLNEEKVKIIGDNLEDLEKEFNDYYKILKKK